MLDALQDLCSIGFDAGGDRSIRPLSWFWHWECDWAMWRATQRTESSSVNRAQDPLKTIEWKWNHRKPKPWRRQRMMTLPISNYKTFNARVRYIKAHGSLAHWFDVSINYDSNINLVIDRYALWTPNDCFSTIFIDYFFLLLQNRILKRNLTDIRLLSKAKPTIPTRITRCPVGWFNQPRKFAFKLKSNKMEFGDPTKITVTATPQFGQQTQKLTIPQNTYLRMQWTGHYRSFDPIDSAVQQQQGHALGVPLPATADTTLPPAFKRTREKKNTHN